LAAAITLSVAAAQQANAHGFAELQTHRIVHPLVRIDPHGVLASEPR
jgi:hypothetical protein